MAIGVLGLGGFFLFGAGAVDGLSTYARIGPRFFPYIVGWGLAATGLLLVWQEIRPQRADYHMARQAVVQAPEDWAAVSWITAGLVANVALLPWAGYIPATMFLFILSARGLGSRCYLSLTLIALSLALVTYLAFTRLLDLRLPPGWLAIILS